MAEQVPHFSFTLTHLAYVCLQDKHFLNFFLFAPLTKQAFQQKDAFHNEAPTPTKGWHAENPLSFHCAAASKATG